MSTLNDKDEKKIFVLYFYHAGSVLGQGEYWKHYFEMATFLVAYSDLSVRLACMCCRSVGWILDHEAL